MARKCHARELPHLQCSDDEAGWWRGLDSNQRTLARADLQSAAFNHSATSPRCRQARQMAAKGCSVNAEIREESPSLASLVRSLLDHPPDGSARGAGEGNRTLVVSLEGFCSTIELHPPAWWTPMPFAFPRRQPRGLDGTGKPRLPKALMTHLNAIAAARTVARWWRSAAHAARWRD